MTETTTLPGADAAWTARAEQLATLLAERGDVRDDAWKAAVAAVPTTSRSAWPATRAASPSRRTT